MSSKKMKTKKNKNKILYKVLTFLEYKVFIQIPDT